MDRHVSHDEIADLLGAYALDAVDADEAAAIARHLEECPACAAEVADHQRVAALLGNTGEEAPVHLWEGIAGQLGEHGGADGYRAPRLGPDGRTAGPTPGGLRRLARRPRPLLLAAAAAVVVIALLSVQIGRLAHRVSTLQSEQGLARLAQVAMGSPGARTVDLLSPGPKRSLVAEVVVERSGTGYLVDKALPGLPAAETYQLWGRTGRRVVSLGVLGDRPATVAVGTGGPGTYSSFLITAEPAGGVPQSTGPPVASSPT